MYVVAVTRWARPVEQEAELLASLLHGAADALVTNCRLTPPVILARFDERKSADSLLAVLRDRGHGAVACAQDQLAAQVSWLVAVTRWARPALDEAELLATVFGVTTGEMQARVARPLPAVLARWLDVDSASALSAVLRDRGHGAVSCDVSRVGVAGALFRPRQFALEAASLLVTRGSEQRRVAWGQIAALLRTPGPRAEAPLQANHRRSSPRGALEPLPATPGMGERLYVIVEPWSQSLLLDEGGLQYGGLGLRLLGTVHQNFISLVDLLRQHATVAWYDEHLARQPPRPARLEPPHPQLPTTAGLHATAMDLAVHLLLSAQAQGQLDAAAPAGSQPGSPSV